jgi:uncharacterized membrane protein
MGEYNQIAGRGLERTAALSDGVFAFAMTLMVLEIHVPAPEVIHSEADLWRALLPLAPRALTYLMSFLTLGIFWVGQQTQLNHFSRADRNLSWLHLTFLAVVALMPFSTNLLTEFIGFRTALVAYWLNVLALGAMLYASWSYALRAGLMTETVTEPLSRAVKRRIVLAQTLYALGAALCLINTYWSIGFIVLVQLNYAIAPKIPGLTKVTG